MTPARCGLLVGLILIAFIFPLSNLAAQAQAALPDAPSASVRRFEFGAQFTDIQLATCYLKAGCDYLPIPQSAAGLAVAFNLNTHLAVDASYNTFWGFDSYPYTWDYGGRGSEFLVGIHARARAGRYGLSAFERPGFGHWNNVTQQGSLGSNVIYAPATYFANEAGGGVDYFASERVRVSVELGDVMIDRRDHHFDEPGFTTWTNNLQTSVGVYVGVGQSIFPKLSAADAQLRNRFFDKTNLLLIVASMLGQSADDVTTQRFHSHGIPEGDPLARPFVDKGWAGQIGLAAIYNAEEISVMYALHRMRYHKVERLVPIAVGAEGAYRGYRNLQSF